MTYEWTDLLGNLGVATILLTYLGLQLGRVDARGLEYSIANAIGASLILVSLAFDFNLSAALVEGFWVLISLLGIGKALRSRQKPDPESVER